jgi:hypothetical protein
MRLLNRIFWITLFITGVVLGQTATYDTLSIYDIQYLENPSATNQETPYQGDTIVVKAYMCHGPRELWIGARWGGFVTAGKGEPWNGFFVIQDDTTKIESLLQYVQEGDEVYFTGRLTTYSGLTQLNILTNPVVPVTIVSAGNTLPQPVRLTLADLASYEAGEKWESMYVRIENVKVTNNSYSGNQCVITDGTGTGYLDDYFNWFRDSLNAGKYKWPANGSILNVQGYVRDLGTYFSINPRSLADIEILSNPPVISNVSRNPGAPTSIDSVLVQALITDNVGVDSAFLHFSVNWQPFTKMIMKLGRTGYYQAYIPAQQDGAFVRYFISARDKEGDLSSYPGDTTERVYHYVVRNNKWSIEDIQNTHGYKNDASGFMGYVITVEGVVMNDSSDYINNFYIQDKDSLWSGIWVYNNVFPAPKKGDWVRVTGTVQENYNVTRIANLTELTVVTPNYGVFEPIKVQVKDICTGAPLAEAYEDVLVSIENLTVVNPFPDGSSGNFGEYTVSDGTGSIRVDDAFTAYNGNLDSSIWLGDQFDKIIGFQYYSFNNYKLLPRNYDDIINHRHVGIEEIKPITDVFRLDPNYPNPFNSQTYIRYHIPATSSVTLIIYNLRGEKVRTLFQGTAAPGNYQLIWNGLDERNRPVSSGIYFCQLKTQNTAVMQKMLYLK